MKTFFSKFLLAAFVSAAAINLFSCKEITPELPDDPNAPTDEFVSEADTIYIEGEYEVPHPDIAMEICRGD